jgi:hypothetical protein
MAIYATAPNLTLLNTGDNYGYSSVLGDVKYFRVRQNEFHDESTYIGCEILRVESFMAWWEGLHCCRRSYEERSTKGEKTATERSLK